MNGPRGIVAKLGAEVFSLRLELGDDGGVGAQPYIQVLECVVIDEVELDVFIAPAFARGRVGGAQKVQLSAFLFHRLRLRLGRFRRLRRGRRGLLARRNTTPRMN